MSNPVLTNYHTHTARCHHADGTERDYIETALRCGYRTLGFSDHTPWRYADPGFVSHIRMLPAELDGYVSTLRALRDEYADRIDVRVGLEVEYFPAYLDWLRGETERLGIEYWIFGCHYDTTDETGPYFGRPTSDRSILRYAEQVEAGLDTGLYACLAHPDLCLNYWAGGFDAACEAACRQICAAAVRCNVPLEYNLAGRRYLHRGDGTLGYTTDAFWQIAAEYPVRAIVGCDAHSPTELDVAGELRRAQEQLRTLGITVIDTL